MTLCFRGWKKLATLVLTAALAAGVTAPQTAEAVDFKVKGTWQVFFEGGNWMPRDRNSSYKHGNDTFAAWQRFRTQIDAVASENLSGSLQFEIGNVNWGDADEGGALGTDGNIVEVRYAYLDWMVPSTDVKVRMGLQLLKLPGIISQWGFSGIFGHDMAGISVSSPIYKGEDLNIDGSFFWARPYNDNSSNDSKSNGYGDNSHQYLDNLDVFALSLPIRSSNWTFNPYFMYAMIGQYSLTGLIVENENARVVPRGGLMPVLGGYEGNGGYVSSFQPYVDKLDRAWGDGFWAGGYFTYHFNNALSFGIEGAYGSVDMGSVSNYKGFGDTNGRNFDVKRAGWYIAGRVDYKTDWGTPGIIGWYGPGDDDDPYNGSERMPNFNTPWGVTNLGFGGTLADTSWKVLGHNPSGLGAVILQVADMPNPLIEGMSHTARAGMYWGTNSASMPKKAKIDLIRRDGPHAYMTTMDNCWELNFNTKYKMYENLTFDLECAYVRLNLDEDTWNNGTGVYDYMNKDNWKFDLVITYRF